MATKLEMYHEVEKVCAANHTIWNLRDGFASLFSRFVAKVTLLEVVFSSENPSRVQLLMAEIDGLLNESLDRLVAAMQQESHGFYQNYQAARVLAV